jgi:hypothetical protein
MELITTAERLYAIKELIASHKAHMNQILLPLEEEQGLLEQTLIDELRGNGIKTIKLENGTSYARYTDFSFAIINEGQAEAWAKKKKLMRIDKVAINKVLKELATELKDMPAGFAVDKVERLKQVKGSES